MLTTISPVVAAARKSSRRLSGLLVMFGVGILAGPTGANAEPYAYVTNYNSNNVSVIDTDNNAVTTTVTVGNSPMAVAITPDGAFAYIVNGNSNNVSVIDTATSTVTTTVAVRTSPGGIAITPDGAFAYVANQNSNNVSVINTATNTVTATVIVGAGPRDVAISPDGAFAYVTNQGSGTVSVIDRASNTVTTTVTVGSVPSGVAITPDGAFAYVTNSGGISGSVSVIDTASNTVTTTVTVGASPGRVAITPNGASAYITNQGSANVSVIDTATNTVTATVAVGSVPFGIAITPMVDEPDPPQLYRLTDLGSLGTEGSTGLYLNNQGHVTGYSQTGTGTRAFLWNGTEMQDLGTLGGTFSMAEGINEQGQITGAASIPGDTAQHAFLWEDGVMTDLGTLGGEWSVGVDINEIGQVVGYAQHADGNATRSFIWEAAAGFMQDIGTLGGNNSDYPFINDAGQVAGRADITSGSSRAFLRMGPLFDLGTLGGDFSAAYDINEARQIVGEARNADGILRAFLWQESVMQELTLPSRAATTASSYAGGINAAGEIVGSANGFGSTFPYDDRAILWTNGVAYDLNTLIDPNDPLAGNVRLRWAWKINDVGQIVVNGFDLNAVGLARVYLATPVTNNDTSPPQIQSNVSGTLGSSGWYVSNVQVSWTVTDEESAVSTTGCETITLSTDMAGITYTCSATSAGGSESESITVRRDATAPTATATATPPANAFGWRKSDVTVTFSGTDALSGGVNCDPQVVIANQGANQSASGRCYDAAGNQGALATASGINIDKTNPTASIVTPGNGSTYNRNQVVNASYSCADGLSGIRSCIGNVAPGQRIDTSKKVNNAKFTVDANDKAGNKGRVTHTYSVN